MAASQPSVEVERCPLRPGRACYLCHPGASGPQTCGVVYLVMHDEDLREELEERWREWHAEHDELPPDEAPCGRAARDDAAP